MELEQAQSLVNDVLKTRLQRSLTEAELAILAGAWNDQTYEQVAEACGYSLNYIQRSTAPKFWKLLSQLFDRQLNKTNARAILSQQLAQQGKVGEIGKIEGSEKIEEIEQPEDARERAVADWGEAIDVSIFYGRTQELSTLTEWIVQDRCRLVAVLGMGGMGKSSLAAKVAQDVTQNSKLKTQNFEYVIWRSLRNAPPLETLLADLVPFVSHQQDTQTKPERLLHWLRTHRCLVILDNAETIMQAGDRAGHYHADYENYGSLFRLIGESAHQSCVLLTSREKPAEVAIMEGIDGWVRSLHLNGSPEAAYALLKAKGLMGTEHDKHTLCDRYSCSPLALKIVSSSIKSLFDGQIAAFLEQDTLIFNSLRYLLEQQFERLSYLEQTIMYWLAINREWTTIAALQDDIVPVTSKAGLLESLESLAWRSLIEKQPNGYTQQPVVMEYVANRFIDQVAAELVTTKLQFFNRYALIKNVVQDYIRESQVRAILLPILNKLSTIFDQPGSLERHLKGILYILHDETASLACYGAGNLINLLRYHNIDLTGYDFSHLTIRHVHLQKVNLHRVNFAYSRFINPVFTHTLSSIFTVAFSPDGTWLATGESTGEIHIWRIDDAQLLIVLKKHENRILAVCFSPDGRFLASASADCTINLWDITNGRFITSLKGHTNSVCSVAFSSDQTLLASAGMDYTIMLWDVQTQQPIRLLEGHCNWVWSVCFSPLPHSKLLASGSADATIKLWDAESGTLLKTLEGHSDRIWSVRFSPDGQWLASSSEDCTVRLWDVETGQLMRTFEGHTSIIWSVSFSANGKLLASASSDQTVRVWNVQTGQLVRILPSSHSNRVWSVHFSPVEVPSSTGTFNLLASGSADCTIKLWNVEAGRLIKTIQGYTNGVRSLDFSGDGTILASGTAADHAVRLWDLTSGRLLNTLQHHTDTIHSVRFGVSITGEEILASGSSDRTVNLWNPRTGRLIRTLHGHTDAIWSVSLHPSGTLAAGAGADYTIRIWNLTTGQLLKTLQGHDGWVWAVCFSPDGKLLASGSGDSTVKLWDVASGQPLQTLQGHTAWVRSVSFSPDGTQVASGSADCTVKLWDVQSGQLLHTLHGHSSWTWQVSFSPDGTRLASSSTDRTVKLWDVESGQLLNTLEGHTSEVWTVRFAPQGTTLASSGADETVRVWDAHTGKCLHVLRSDRPYEGMTITGVTGITDAQKAALKLLGAVEE